MTGPDREPGRDLPAGRRVALALMPLEAARQLHAAGKIADRDLALMNLGTINEVGRIHADLKVGTDDDDLRAI